MITEIQLDSLIRAIKGGWIKLDQVPKELREKVSEILNARKNERWRKRFDGVCWRQSHRNGNNTVVRFNIEEVFEDDVLVGYKAYEVKVKDLSNESIKRAVVADLCDKSELEMVNNYQSYSLGISDNEQYLEDYKKYLTMLNEIDKMIDDEWNNNL